MNIAILGAPGSFTQDAAEHYCKQNDIAFRPIRRESSNGVFVAVEKQKADIGIVPIANSVGGVVVETLKALSTHGFSPLSLLELPVTQNLMTLPGILPKEINKIISHPQALAQCRLYLSRNWLKTAKGEYSTTAKAAKDLSLGKLGKYTAVIASEEAASLYGLHIAAPNIQDSRFNFTQFLVFSIDGKSGSASKKMKAKHRLKTESVQT